MPLPLLLFLLLFLLPCTQAVVAVEDGGVEVEALAHPGDEEGTAGIRIEVEEHKDVRVEAADPLNGGREEEREDTWRGEY